MDCYCVTRAGVSLDVMAKSFLESRKKNGKLFDFVSAPSAKHFDLTVISYVDNNKIKYIFEINLCRSGGKRSERISCDQQMFVRPEHLPNHAPRPLLIDFIK